MQLMSYACVRKFHYILLEIKLEQGLVIVFLQLQVIVFFVSQGLESIHRTSSGTAAGSAMEIPESKYY